MGNRAVVIFHDQETVSPTVYLHWCGGEVPTLLSNLAEYMQGRYGDAEYAAARFAGLCHILLEGNLSLGIWSNAFSIAELRDETRMSDYSQGDAGTVIVNTKDFTWKAYGGFLAVHAKTSADRTTEA